MKKVKLKKLISLITVMLYVLTLIPANIAVAASSTASAYDVHIKGNFYDGATLTAHYTPYSSDNSAIDETKTKYTWYHRNINISSFAITVTKFAEKIGDPTCVIPTDICETGYFNAMKNIFVTVTTADASGNYGEPVLSGFYSYPVTGTTSTHSRRNKASYAHLVPKNPEGTVLVGDTLVARYSYLSINNIAEGATQFTWYRKDTHDGTATEIQSGTSAEYTLTKDDIGKWIECTVAPYDVNGTAYLTSTAKIHYGNLGLLNGVTSSFTFFTESKCAETSLVYPMHKLLSDGGALNSNNGNIPYASSFVSHATYQQPGEIKYDLGEVMPLDGVFFDIRSLGATGSAFASYSISYSENGTTWYDIYSTTAAATGAFEVSLPKTVNARYVKFYTADKHYKAVINDFYPISFIGAPTFELLGDKKMAILIGQDYDEAGYVLKDSRGNVVPADDYEIDIVGDVDTDVADTYEITYTATYGGTEFTQTREVTVGTGIKTPGDMAFGMEVTSVNAENDEALTDGNPNTLWEATDEEAEAVINLGAVQPISKFVINEEGENVTGFNLYISTNGEDWSDPVHSGDSLLDVINIDPEEGQYVKFEIISSSENAQIKDFEVHASDDAKVYLASAKFEAEFENKTVTKDFSLSATGAYGTTITWTSSDEDVIDIVGNTAKVTRDDSNHTVTLTATFSLNEAQTESRNFNVTVKKAVDISAISAYDVHIKGNFYDGETLTANYTPYSSDGYDLDETKTKYTWYYRTINLVGGDAITVTKFEEKIGDNTCVIPYDICEKSYFNAMKNIFVAVTTADESGDYGEPVVSGFYGYPVCNDTDNRNKKNKAIFAHLVPKNEEGSVEIGDTLVARYTYISVAKKAEGATTFTWYRKDTPDGAGTEIKSGTSSEYTLTKADIGKWIECVVTPYDVDGTKYDSSTAKIHYGNLGFLRGVKSTNANFTESTYAETSFTYPMHRLLCDSTGYLKKDAPAIISGPFVNSTTYLAPGEIKYDLGEAMPLEGVFLDLWELGGMTSYKIQYYSEDDSEWHDIYSTEAAVAEAKEHKLSEVVNTRYVRFYTENAHYKARINDFYPISFMGTPTFELLGEKEIAILTGQSYTEPGYELRDSSGNVIDENDYEIDIDGDNFATTVEGEHEITYTVTYRGIEFSESRTVTVANGVKTPGDMAFGSDVTSHNATGSDNLTDGNPYTLWETTSLPATAVIDFGEKQAFSELRIDEDGENVSSYNIYVSDNGSAWGDSVYTGTSFEGTILIPSTEARYLKLEITEASGSVKIKNMEVHLDDQSKLTLEKNTYTPPFATDNVRETFSLPRKGNYGAEITWSVKSGSAITVQGYTANVTRGITDETVVLTASFKIGALDPVTKDITVTVKGNPVTEGGLSTATAYDVHITGNFVKGGVLTAEYKYYDPAGNPENPEAVVYTWYQDASGDFGTEPLEIGTGKTLTITEAIRAAGKNNVFVTVQTTSTLNDEGVVGAPVYSRFYGGILTPNSTASETGTPKALGAHLVPQNPEGTTLPGDVIKAYFTYQEPNLLAEGAHIYEWRTYASLKEHEVPVTVQKGTSNAYEIKAEDFGKYIECIITPVSSDGAQGTAIKTRNSLGNLAFASGVNVKFENSPRENSQYGHNAYFSHGHYPAQLLLTDGGGNEGVQSFLYAKWANAQGGYNPGVIYDLGEAKEFNGFFINVKSFDSTSPIQDMTFSYSLTGEEGSWTELTPFAAPLGETEVLLERTVQARFVKYTYRQGGSKLQMSEFYPLLTEESIPTITLNGKETMYVLQGEAWVDPGYTATASTGETLEAVVSGDVVNTAEVGTYEIIYTVTHSIYPTVTVKRTVVVDTGIPSEGDMAFRKNVTSYNANNALALTDGNPYTSFEITGLPAHAVIDLGEEMPVSRFVLDEDGENISSHNIYLSSDGENWGEAVYSGNAKDVVVEEEAHKPKYARFVKLEITASSENAKIKAFEVHLTADSMLYLAKEALELSGADNLYSYIELPKKGLYDAALTWATSDSSLVSTEGTVTRSEERKEAVLTATLTLPGATTLTKDITVSIAPFSEPFATDVHIKGNMIIGETLTADFNYYDPENIPEGDSVYQWWRGNGFASGEAGKISGATGKTYTLTEEDQSYNIYVSVIAKNKTGEGTKEAFSAIYAAPLTVSIEEEPVVSNPYISTTSSTETMVAGDTVRVHYTYQERGLSKEGKTTYLWITKETPNSAPKTVQAESTKDTYTLTKDDFGKWIECIITPISESGLRGKSVTAKNHYGNGFLSNNTKSHTGTSWMYSQKGINAGRIYAFDEAGSNQCNRTTDLSEIVYSMDAGREIEFDAVYIKAGSGEKLKLEYSSDGENYTEIPLGEKEKTISGDRDLQFSNVIRARYIRLALTNKSKGYYEMRAFYPYITYKAGPKLTVEKAEGEEIRQFQPFADNAFTALDPYGENVNNIVVTEGSVDTSVLGDYKLTYILEMAGYPIVTATKVYNVVAGIPTEGDSAYGKQVTASSPAQTLTDGNPYTLWTSSEANENIIVDFGEKTGISKLYLGEQGANITAASIFRSDDGKNWSKVTENASLTEGSIRFEPQQTRYIKVSVQAAAPFTLHSIEASLDEEGKIKLAHSNLEISGNLKSVTEDLALPKTGDYGVEITWESGNNKVVDSEGAITRGEKDVTVKLTATLKNDALTLTKEFSVTVKAHPAYAEGGSSGGSSGGGSSSGGFGSFGGGSGGAASNMNSQPQSPATPSEPYKVFKDVADSHWAAEYINTLSEENVISGKGNGSYEPESNITRAEFLKLLIESLGITAETEIANSFSDVAKDSWYEKYVNIAVALGIANGTGEGTFSPDAPILRRDMAVLAHRAVEAAGKELKKENVAALIDNHLIADYAKASVNVLATAGIINGNEKGEFMPDSLANRAQSAKIIYMLKEQVKE